MRGASPPPLAPYTPSAYLAMPQRLRRRRRPLEERPPPHWFTLGSLRRLGERIRHPPPPAKEEHYKWFLAPRFDVPLQDVMEDKHLAPLSRQDFEDFLQFADGTIENLYFYEWVRNYRQMYLEWTDSVLPTAGANMSSSSKGVYRSRDLWERLKDCQDRRLKEEFTSAKALFFEQGAPYRLNVDNEFLEKVFNIPNHPPRQGDHQELTDKLPSFPNQPEPSLFDPIQQQVDAALEEAFVRFRRLAFCNSGLWHHCVGHIGGAVILACGLALYCLGVMSRKRRYVGGSLPIIWFGLWFMLVSGNNHCLVVFVTGDARQLYPHELARPLPADATPPPMYSLARAPNDMESTYSFNRKASTTSNLLPLVNTPTLSQPRSTYHPLTRLNSRRASEPIMKLVSQHVEWEGRPQDKIPQSTAKAEIQLPPARRTKNLPRSSLAVDVGQANGLDPRVAVVDHTTRQAVVEWPEESQLDSPVFTEENDFGIVISEAYEEDEPGPFLFPALAEDRPAPAHSFTGHNEEPIQLHFISGSSQEPLAPLVQAPEYAAQRRRTVLDLFAESCASRRGSKASEVERPGPFVRLQLVEFEFQLLSRCVPWRQGVRKEKASSHHFIGYCGKDSSSSMNTPRSLPSIRVGWLYINLGEPRLSTFSLPIMMAPDTHPLSPAEITIEPRQPGPDDIALSDFSGHLGSGPEWERMELPFNLPVIAPSISNEQPSTWSLKPATIKSFPTRLRNAPPRPRGVPLRKKFAIIPEYDIPLSEILDDLHASPLSLREFEEYLLYVERTVENLYFCLWFRQYTQTYRDWERRQPPTSDTDFGSPSTSTFRRPTGRDRTQSINVPLANSFQRAKRLFFDPSSQYELNVTEDMIDPIREWVKPPKKHTSDSKKLRRVEAWEESPEPEPRAEPEAEIQELSFVHPHPDSFQRVLTEIEGSLRQSLTRFFQLSFTNSGRSHDKLGYSVWLLYTIASVAASVSLIINHRHRALRLVVTPILLMAWTVGISTYNGICPAIFAFGEARQMYPYEIFVFKCRMFVQNPREPTRIDWKYAGESNKNVTSADPIIRPKHTYRPRRTSRFPAVRRLLGASGHKKRLKPQLDIERGRQQEGGFGFRVEAEPEQDRSFGNLHETLEPETPMPALPSPAYIPGKHSTVSVHRLGEQMHKHPWTPTAAAFGGFDVYALRPQPVSGRRRPHIPHLTSNHSNISPESCETEIEIPDQDELARQFDLDLGDPRALGLYGHMVTIPNPIVRYVHHEIFVRSAWVAIVVTIPIMVIILVIP
ncbi:unnamed protein product [Rhizoctonia solani]|uniref:RGS domain-containing protein n=1 Tax=Rhizoctonia solani TaxID=456999 RepID=A0A8H3HIX3_9AGAM|nr:unnamed protein product [Rhizoctonia solani]